MRNLYELKITGKDTKRFLNYLLLHNVSIFRITYALEDILLLVDKNNLEKIKKIKTSYEINIVKYYGLVKLKHIFKQNKVFLITLFFGFIFLFLLSNMVFDIEVVHNDQDLRSLILTEVNNRGINKFHFRVSYPTKEKIKTAILEKYKDRIEWLEITNIGTKYVINVEERIINDIKKDNTPRHIVADKDGVIVSIEASYGEILKKINDYVQKDDIIISGSITKNGQIVSNVKAEGKIYAETWYQVSVDMPLTYYEQKNTGVSKKTFVLKVFNKYYQINPFKQNKYADIVAINHPFLPISISFTNVKEVLIIDEVYTMEEAINKGLEIGYAKMSKQLTVGEKILLQKVLKAIVSSDKVEIDIFFKVYEDITNYQKINEVINNE